VVSTTKCPVARALQRNVHKSINVGITWAQGKGGFRIQLPRVAAIAIENMIVNGLNRLPEKEWMQPFTFELTAAQIRTLKGK